MYCTKIDSRHRISYRLLCGLIGFCLSAIIFAQTDTLSIRLLSNAQAHLEAGRYKAARIAYTIFLQKDSTVYDALFGMARINAFENNYEESIKFYNALLRHYAGDPDAILGRAQVYTLQGVYNLAEKEFISITKRFPDLEEAWSSLGSLYRLWDKPDEAEEVYSHLIALLPENPNYYIERGNIYLKQRREKEAHQDFERAIELGADANRTYTVLMKLNRRPQEAVLNGGFSYRNESYTGDSLNWSAYSEFAKIAGSKGTYIFSMMQISRFGVTDNTIGLKGSFNFRNNGYLSIRGRLADAPKFLAKNTISLDIFKESGNGGEVSFGVSRMNFTKEPVTVYRMSLGKYLGNWYFHGKGIGIPYKGTTYQNTIFSGRRFLRTVTQYFEAFYGTSTVPYNIISIEDLSRDSATTYGITFQKKILNQFLFFVTWESRTEKSLSTQTVAFGYWFNSR